MNKKKKAIFSLSIGIPSIIAFGYLVGGWAALALIMVLWANNIEQM